MTLQRRDFLRGAAALSASLPCIGMANTPDKKQVAAKKNLVIITEDLGFYDPFFKPITDDPGSSPLLKILDRFHNEMTVFREINGPEIGNGHGNKVRLLTCGRRQSNGAYMSLDQVAADGIVQNTRFKHFNLGPRGISWNRHSREEQTDAQSGPEEIYRKLFTKTVPDDVLENKIRSLSMFRGRVLPTSDASYREALRGLEQEFNIDLEWNKKPVGEVELDLQLHLSDAHDRGAISPWEQQLELVRYGLQYQRAQIFVVTAPFIDKTAQIGVEATYHQLGHKTSRKLGAGSSEQLLKLETHLFEGIAKFLGKLKENDLFDDTIVLLVGGFSDAGNHRRDNIPTALIGGEFRHQGVVDCVRDDKLLIQQSHLYLSVLHQMGIDADDFAGDPANVDHLVI